MKIKSYYASTDSIYKNPDAYLNVLPDNLKRHVQKISDLNAKVCSLGGALLLNIASKEAGADISKVVYNEKGKPYIPGGDFYFSISHTKGYAAISFGKHPSGCDIQIEKDVNLKISERFFSEKERTSVISSKENKKEFFDIWCRKESVYKLSGEIYCTKENEKNYVFNDFMLNDNLHFCVCAKEGGFEKPMLIDLDTVF